MTNPKIKEPQVLTIKSFSICHLIRAPGIAPSEIHNNINAS